METREQVSAELRTVRRISQLESEEQSRSHTYDPAIFRHPSQRMTTGLEERARDIQTSASRGVHEADLLTALSRYCGLPMENIQVFAGTTAALETFTDRYIRLGDSVLVAGPVEESFRRVAEASGAEITYNYSPSPFSSDPDGLVLKANDSTRLVFLSNPSYFAGAVYTNAEIEYLLEQVPQALVIVDETYYEYYGTTSAELVHRWENLVILRSFSEGPGLAGLQCAYILTSRRNLAELNKYRTESISLSDTTRAAAMAVLSDIDAIRCRTEQMRENMIYLSARLRGFAVSCRITPTNLLLLKVEDTSRIMQFLKSRGIFCQDLSFYPQMEDYLGIAVGDDGHSTRVVEAFEQMPAAWFGRTRPGRVRLTLNRPAEHIASLSDQAGSPLLPEMEEALNDQTSIEEPARAD